MTLKINNEKKCNNIFWFIISKNEYEVVIIQWNSHELNLDTSIFKGIIFKK